MRSTGLVLAAGAIAAANEVVFAPAVGTGNKTGPNGTNAAGQAFNDFNWRLIPATVILALVLGGFETVAPQFAVGLGGLVLLSVLIIPVGNAPTPVDNLAKFLGV
jgi:hypothetical protein